MLVDFFSFSFSFLSSVLRGSCRPRHYTGYKRSTRLRSSNNGVWSDTKTSIRLATSQKNSVFARKTIWLERSNILRRYNYRRLTFIETISSSILAKVDLCNHTDEKSSEVFTLKQSATFHSHKDAVSCVSLMNGGTGDELISVGHDGILKLYSTKTGKLTRSVSLSPLPLSSCISYSPLAQSKILVAGCWDNTMWVSGLKINSLNHLESRDTRSNSECLFFPISSLLTLGSFMTSSLDG